MRQNRDAKRRGFSQILPQLYHLAGQAGCPSTCNHRNQHQFFVVEEEQQHDFHCVKVALIEATAIAQSDPEDVSDVAIHGILHQTPSHSVW